MKTGGIGALEENDFMKLGRLDIALAIRTLKRWGANNDFRISLNVPETPNWCWVQAIKRIWNEKKMKYDEMLNTVFTSVRENTLAFTTPQDGGDIEKILADIIKEFANENAIPSREIGIKLNMWEKKVWVIPTFERIKKINGIGVLLHLEKEKVWYLSDGKEISTTKRVDEDGC